MSILCGKSKNNQIILIGDFENKEELFCVDCNTSLIRKRGNIRNHHFSHKNLTNCCSESSQHLYVKEFINRNINKILFCNKCSYCKKSEYENFKDCKVILEKTYKKYKLDCGIFENNELICAIEVYHTHLTEKEKINTIVNDGIGYYEICTSDVIKNNELVVFPVQNEIILNNIHHTHKCDKCIKLILLKEKEYLSDQVETVFVPKKHKVKRYCKKCMNIFSLNNTTECIRIKFCDKCR